MFHSSMIMMMMIRRSLNKIYFEDLAKAFRKLLIQLLPHKTDQNVFYLLCPSPSRYFAWFGLFARSSSIASLNITILKQAFLNIPISKQDFLNIPILKQTSLNITKMKQHVKNVTGKKNNIETNFPKHYKNETTCEKCHWKEEQEPFSVVQSFSSSSPSTSSPSS